MKNLAGNKECDKFIQIELNKANVKPVKQEQVNSEVAYSLIGKVGNWALTRAWYYWVAVASDKGIPLKTALEMHNKKHPDHMYDEHSGVGQYGNVIRVGGHCGCPSPDEYGGRSGFVTSYHIDSQEGLNEFVRVVNAL